VKRLTLLAALPWLLWSAALAAADPELQLRGEPVQGGIVIGRVEPGTRVSLDGRALPVAADGSFLAGFGRDADPEATLELRRRDGAQATRRLAVRQREYAVQRIDGLPERQVTPPPEVLERIRVEAARVADARARADDRTDFLSGFEWPAEARGSGVYGSQRILNGEPRQPHYGVDLALPRGAPVAAPADGVVTLAESDLYFSGGTLIMDHGLGLSSTFLHLHRILVAPGDRVLRGQVVAEAGATGRATGPHLDWRMNLGEARIDPELVLRALPATVD
jgi:murein DD-endopeptidase MepM/ murein hydrolase activator NlpD